MGAGSSILSPELEKQLSKESLKLFNELRAECDEANMPPDLLSEVLTRKFKELIEIENKKHGKNKVIAAPANESSDRHTLGHSKQRRGSKVSDPNEHHGRAESPNTDLARQRGENKHNDLPLMHIETGNTPVRSRRNSKQHDIHVIDSHNKVDKTRKNSKAPEVHEMLLQSLSVEEEDDSGLMDEEKMSYEMQMVMDEVSDLHLGDFDKNYTTQLVHKVFNADKYDRLHKARSRNDHSDDHKPHRHGHSNCAEEVHETAFKCHVCSMFFDSEQALDFHCDYSDLHRANLHLREKRLEAAHKEAIRLTGLARKVMQTLFDTLSPVNEPSAPLDKAEQTEKTTIQPKEGYDAVLAAINAKEVHHHEVQHKWRRALNKVLHRNLAAKFAQILETRINVPKGVEMMYEGSKHFFRTKSTYDLRFLHHEMFRIFEIVPTFVPYNHETCQLESTDSATFLPATRIYLNFDELMKAFFGYNIVHSGLTDGPTNLGAAPNMEQVKGTFHAAEVHALALFVSNRIKIHKSHAPDDALFFDLHKINHDMVIKTLPRRFAPVLIDPEVVRNIWVQRIEDAKKPPVLEKRRSLNVAADTETKVTEYVQDVVSADSAATVTPTEGNGV